MARRFCRAGFVVLAYDHPGFGASDGSPRQNVDPHRQIQGYRDAVASLRGDPAVDANRVGVWGPSFSGGEVIVLAADERLRLGAAVAQVPFVGLLRRVRSQFRHEARGCNEFLRSPPARSSG